MIPKLIFVILSNGAALYLADRFIDGFAVYPPQFQSFFIAAFVFGVVNITVRPLLKLLFTPLIILTLGLATILVNVIVLKFLDIISDVVMISGTLPLLYATLLIAVVNGVLHSIINHRDSKQ